MESTEKSVNSTSAAEEVEKISEAAEDTAAVSETEAEERSEDELLDIEKKIRVSHSVKTIQETLIYVAVAVVITFIICKVLMIAGVL